MKTTSRLLAFILTLSILISSVSGRDIIDFNYDWEFSLTQSSTQSDTVPAANWQKITIPHDWSIINGYTQNNSACSTGFVQGGIGWYRKTFPTTAEDLQKTIRIEFDGIYNHSTVWINGKELGYRPYGYTSFSYDLTPHLNSTGEDNELLVRVNRTQYADSRWYTGSGIYRNVRLVKTNPIHIPQWGVKITTPEVSSDVATIAVKSTVQIPSGIPSGEPILFKLFLLDNNENLVAHDEQTVDLSGIENQTTVINSALQLTTPHLWDLNTPYLYQARVVLSQGETILDNYYQSFGVRSISYDSNKGFFLNGKPVKIKGVNIHHDAGSLGAAVPKDIWYSRVQKLKDMGCNAIRMAHNAHSPELMKACDDLGMLVMAEAFDEWDIPKGKSVEWLSDNAAPPEISKSYPEYFNEWAERDLKALIRRDFNHPSVIMWSIGNEIEWTYDYYHKSAIFEKAEAGSENTTQMAIYDGEAIMKKMHGLLDGKTDRLTEIARQLRKWLDEEDTTRFVTCGSVRPSVALASGYADAVDILGMNYRAVQYDAAHKAYPDAKLIGSENWVTWQEWQDVKDRDFIGGIFVWTGFAYLGEAGPWPRKGLNISIFDYSGVLTPRGHLFESMWKDEPKVFMETIPLAKSEYHYDTEKGWVFEQRKAPIPRMQWLRKWEWFQTSRHWNYENDGEEILIQAYSNCPMAELFLDGTSLGIKKLEDHNDGCLKWVVPFKKGELKLVGLDESQHPIASYSIVTADEISEIRLKTDRLFMEANQKDVFQIWAECFDQNGNPVYHADQPIRFVHNGPVSRLAVDNGCEYNVQNHQDDHVSTWEGRAYAVYQSTDTSGEVSVRAIINGIESNTVSVTVE